ncbi:related to molybdenum cofactor biosynthetic protein [Serendipita indica DSM 11827]|uniref:Related to molybdenum cofactor biosynthetic protein n=1 Tax=Serendipita indica (strain DSM 11827) TaxID=1109443 RepID=G4TRR2_SERID|nr:related to molybdenum cofactor biosynthetic protein [Serendipita indica DSM 11827]
MDERKLPLADYQRFGRQMILDGFERIQAQLKLRDSKIVVVGAGGLGCPALQHLATVGVGTLGVVDHDRVELSNLHRQILHTEARIGKYKAESAAMAIQELNSSTVVNVYTTMLTSQNAKDILSQYDIILDCTDNAPTRYLLSDVSVTLGKPLVSGAAMKCIFPKPPSPDLVGTCEESGVLGVVTGIIGSLQALEAIKLAIGQHEGKPSLLLFSAMGLPPFRSVKLRAKRPQCPACGTEASSAKIEETDYVAFCGGLPTDWEAKGLVSDGTQSRMRPSELRDALAMPEAAWKILDVRSPAEFSICHLANSQNVPLSQLLHDPLAHLPAQSNVAIVCRLGNDSQIAAKALNEMAISRDSTQRITDMIGGLRAWSREVDPMFPIY